MGIVCSVSVRLWWVPIAVSSGVHLGLAAWMLLAPAHRAETKRAFEPVEVVILEAPPPPPAAPPPTVLPEPERAARTPAPPRRPRVRRPPREREVALEDPPVVEDRAVAPAVSPVDGPAEARAEAPAEARAEAPAGAGEATKPPGEVAGTPPSAPRPGGTGNVRDLDSISLAPVLEPPGPAVIPKPRVDGAPGLPKLEPSRGGGYVYKDTAFRARIAPDGTVRFEDHWQGMQPEKGVAFAADLTELLMRAAGTDPYGVEKAKFLETTRELRTELSRAACEERNRESLLELGRRLEETWRDERLTAGERRRLLFEMWDECAEDGGEDIRQLGAMARATIAAFIQRRLPPESAEAYSAEELALLNGRRRSTAPFEPYAAR